MPFEFHLNPNLRSEVNQKVQDTLDRLKGSDFTITSSLHSLFVCDGSDVQVTFVSEGERVGERLNFTRSEAADLGQKIIQNGSWDGFPVSGISVEALRNFGQRLRDYGLNGA